MAYLYFIHLILIYYLLPIGKCEKLNIDSNGVYYFEDPATNCRIPTCIIQNTELNYCSKEQYPFIAIKTTPPVAARTYRSPSPLHPPITFISKLPNLIPYTIIHDETGYYYLYIVMPETLNGYWTYEKNYHLEKTKIHKPEREEKQYKLVRDDYKFDFRSGIKKKPTIIPLNVTLCIPANNTICTQDEVASYETFLKQKFKSIKNNDQTNSYKNKNSNSTTANEIDISKDLLYPENINIYSKEYAENIGKILAKKIRNYFECPINIIHLTIDIKLNNYNNTQKVAAILRYQVEAEY